MAKPQLALAEGLSEQAGKTLEAQVLQVCPGFVMSVNDVERETPTMFGRRNATLAHLLELATAHPEAFRPFRRVYAFGGTVNTDNRADSVLVPFLTIYASENAFFLGQRRIDPTKQIFRSLEIKGDEDLGPNGSLACQGCTGI
jgi:hypothetical protein